MLTKFAFSSIICYRYIKYQISLPPQNFVNMIVNHERREHIGSEGRAVTWTFAFNRSLEKLCFHICFLKLYVTSETLDSERLGSLAFFFHFFPFVRFHEDLH